MITSLLITDLTRMRDRKVCIAGYDRKNTCVRPVFEKARIPEEWLWQMKTPVIRPFAWVDFDLIAPRPETPHVEDVVVRQEYRRAHGMMPEGERQVWLKEHCYPTLEAIFETRIHGDHGHYIESRCGARSLGTARVRQVIGIQYDLRPRDGLEKWEYRLEFLDEGGMYFNLPVTDLALRYYFDYLRNVDHLEPREIGRRTFQALAGVPVYVRVGLTRGNWEKHPGCSHLQVNSIFSFPDYLGGKCFADFDPRLYREEVPFWGS